MLKLKYDATEGVIRSIDDTPGLLVITAGAGRPMSFAVSPTVHHTADVRDQARKGGAAMGMLDAADHEINELDIDDVVSAVANQETLARLATVASATASSVMTAAISYARWDAAHDVIDWLEEFVNEMRRRRAEFKEQAA